MYNIYLAVLIKKLFQVPKILIFIFNNNNNNMGRAIEYNFSKNESTIIVEVHNITCI